jgi:hypothetical protein
LRSGKQGIDQGLTPNAKLNYAWINNALLSAVLTNTVSRYHLSHTPRTLLGYARSPSSAFRRPAISTVTPPGREGVPENCYGLNKASDRLSRVKPLAAAKSVNRRIAEERSETETRSCHRA